MHIYAEGGGPGRLLDRVFRQGWSRFFRKAGLGGRLPKVIAGQSRERTFDAFKTAVRQRQPEELPLLLVDSEVPTAPGRTVWQHLKDYRPSGTTDQQAFLMVQVMETWFVADRTTLRGFFGAGYRDNHIPAWPDVEAVGKQQIYDAINNATRNCLPRYRKGMLSFELLGRLNPAEVEAKCPHARELLAAMRAL